MRYPAIAVAFIAIVAACSGGGSGPSASLSAAPASPAGSGIAGAVRIEVKLTDALKIEPAEIRVKAGQAVTFVVTNSGAIAHEFFLGDEAAQAKHEQEMASGGMLMDEPNGIVVDPGQTKELTHTFATPGSSLAGCHVPGHYPAGMKAAITVTGPG